MQNEWLSICISSASCITLDMKCDFYWKTSLRPIHPGISPLLAVVEAEYDYSSSVLWRSLFL